MLTASVTVDGSAAARSVQVATVVPVVTASTASLAVNATTLVIHGFGFSTTAANDTVTFAGARDRDGRQRHGHDIDGDGLEWLDLGEPDATVTSNSVSSPRPACRWPTVTPVVDGKHVGPASDRHEPDHSWLRLSTRRRPTTSLSSAAARQGTVSGATATTLTVTGLSGLTGGALTASVNVDGVGSGAAVEVARCAGGDCRDSQLAANATS